MKIDCEIKINKKSFVSPSWHVRSESITTALNVSGNTIVKFQSQYKNFNNQ